MLREAQSGQEARVAGLRPAVDDGVLDATGRTRGRWDHLSPAAVLRLQRLVGNAAVAGMVHPARHRAAPIAVQRSGCGDTCRCGGRCGPQGEEETDAAVPSVQTQPAMVVQRQEFGTKPCTDLIAEDDWKIKGAKDKEGYDTGNWYKDVARVIIDASGARGIDFDRALFVVANARGEQGPQDPGPRRYRILNIQVTDEQRKGAKPDPANPKILVTPEGRKFTWLCSPEDGEVCLTRPKVVHGCEDFAKGFKMTPSQCLLKSPFFVYDNLEESINHYLDHVTEKRQDAADILMKKGKGEKAGIEEFGRALKHGTDLQYVPKLCDNYNTVIADMKQIFDQAIQTKTKCLDDGWKKISEGWENLNKAKARHRQLAAEADRRRAENPPRAAQPVGLATAALEVRQWERKLAELEAQMKQLEKNIEELKKRKAGLHPVPCGGGRGGSGGKAGGYPPAG
jgi:hypothetical protein